MSENLLNLVNTIRDRKNKDEDKSYTSSLLSGGLSKCIDKMEEEFSELKEALNDKSNIVHEAADTIYHILVTLEAASTALALPSLIPSTRWSKLPTPPEAITGILTVEDILSINSLS